MIYSRYIWKVESYKENIEKKNVEILKKISQKESEFLMEQTAVRLVDGVIDNIYEKELLFLLKDLIEERIKEVNWKIILKLEFIY